MKRTLQIVIDAHKDGVRCGSCVYRTDYSEWLVRCKFLWSDANTCEQDMTNLVPRKGVLARRLQRCIDAEREAP
jgi:hypothetical protein